MNQFDVACCMVFFIMMIISIPLMWFVMLPVIFEFFCGNSVPLHQAVEDGSFALFIGSIGFSVIILAVGMYLDGVVA